MKAQKYFKELVEVIPFSIDLRETHPNEIDVGLMADQIGRFQRVAAMRTNAGEQGMENEEKFKNDGKYKHKMN